MIPVIPRKSNSSKGNPEFDGYPYRLRHLVENAFAQPPERYINFIQAKEQIQQRGQKLDLLQQYNKKIDIEKILAKYPQATAFLPLKASAVDMTVLVDQKSNVIKIVDLRPWH